MPLKLRNSENGYAAVKGFKHGIMPVKTDYRKGCFWTKAQPFLAIPPQDGFRRINSAAGREGWNLGSVSFRLESKA